MLTVSKKTLKLYVAVLLARFCVCSVGNEGKSCRSSKFEQCRSFNDHIIHGLWKSRYAPKFRALKTSLEGNGITDVEGNVGRT